jgi:membrane fusion protein (multidrug efflux system)
MNAPQASEPNIVRRRGLSAIAALVVVSSLAWSVWHWLGGRHQQNTDNAYVAGNVVQITPQTDGTVLAIQADDTDYVRAGQVLVRMDAADAQLALKQARAVLAETVRDVRTLFANNATLAAQVGQRQAAVDQAVAALASAQNDVNRRAPLAASGALASEDYEHTRTRLAAALGDVAAARSALLAASGALAASQARTEGTTVEEHPSVQRAAAKLREAWLAQQRVELLAPTDGHIAKRGVQLGQRVHAGVPLMTLVALDRLWVEANFKESQLRSLRIGQPVTLRSDVYPADVVYHGKVQGLAAGTGAAFSLLPAQNATGNWIKIVQRVPVRIALEPQELALHPLRVGLSMNVTVDTRDQTGKALADAPRSIPAVPGAAEDLRDAPAQADVQRIIAANLGRPLAYKVRAGNASRHAGT